MIKVDNLKEIVNQLKVINDVVPNLNHGGCGIFALTLADNLYAKGIQCQLAIIGSMGTTNEVIYNNSVYNVVEICKKRNSEINARQLHDNGFTLYHVMVQVETQEGTFYLDSEGIYDHPRNSRWSIDIEGVADIETMRPFIERPEGWNRMYNRNFNAKVYKMVNSTIEKVIKTPIYNESERVYATI
jgi:hypothetical protein